MLLSPFRVLLVLLSLLQLTDGFNVEEDLGAMLDGTASKHVVSNRLGGPSTSSTGAVPFGGSQPEKDAVEEARIIGGELTDPNQYPFFTGICRNADCTPAEGSTVVRSFSCGGSLISPTYVLTAGKFFFCLAF